MLCSDTWQTIYQDPGLIFVCLRPRNAICTVSSVNTVWGTIYGESSASTAVLLVNYCINKWKMLFPFTLWFVYCQPATYSVEKYILLINNYIPYTVYRKKGFTLFLSVWRGRKKKDAGMFFFRAMKNCRCCQLQTRLLENTFLNNWASLSN